MRDRRVQVGMVDLLGGRPAVGSPGSTPPDVIAEWFESVIAELDRGPLLVH